MDEYYIDYDSSTGYYIVTDGSKTYGEFETFDDAQNSLDDISYQGMEIESDKEIRQRNPVTYLVTKHYKNNIYVAKPNNRYAKYYMSSTSLSKMHDDKSLLRFNNRKDAAEEAKRRNELDPHTPFTWRPEEE